MLEIIGIFLFLILAAIIAKVATHKIIEATAKETNSDPQTDGCLLSIFGRGLYYFIFFLILIVLGFLYMILNFIFGLF